MPTNNSLERTCPECEEEMTAVYDKNKTVTCWKCIECGKILLVNKEKP